MCSGIEAASVAWGPLGWKAAWFSEIEPFPSEVLGHHYPEVPNLGSMTEIAALIALGVVEAPDILCGGTPCQAFSVAGLRRSLDDARGNLSLVFCEIANAIDDQRRTDGQDPCIVFWENVPGVLNTKDNAFGCFLAGLAGEDDPLQPPGGKWQNAGCVFGPQRAVAWRVLDAQYFGVAQRRRRVFVVASARDGFDPAAVLFEFDGVRRDTAPSREAWQNAAPTIAGCSNGGGSNGLGRDVDSADSLQVITMAHGQGGAEIGFDRGPTLTCNHEAPIAAYPATVHTLRGEGFDASEDGTGRGTPLVPVHRDIAPTLTSNYGKQPDSSDTSSGPMLVPVTQPYTLAIRGRGDTHQLEYRQDGTANALLTPNGGRGGIGVGAIAAPVAIRPDATPKWQDDLAFTLTQPSPTGGGQPQAIAFHPTQDPISSADLCHAIGTGSRQGCATAAVMHAMRESGQGYWMEDDIAGTIDANMGMSGHANRPAVIKQPAMQVRRLTPVECERLQGFPDNYTAIPWRKKPASDCPDGPRYKALGNSWAVPVVRWIGARIDCLANLV